MIASKGMRFFLHQAPWSSLVRNQRCLHVEPRSDHLRLVNRNETMDFHYIWLRHNCLTVGQSVHPKTGERIIDCADIPSAIKPERVEWIDQDQQLKIVWSGDHSSLFDLAFLRANAYGKNRQQAKKPHAILDDVELIFDVNQKERYMADCYHRLKQFGLVVVRQRGLDTEEIMYVHWYIYDGSLIALHSSKDFLPCGASVVETHFGRIEDLRTDNTTNKNTDQLGYTDSAINLHTDQPFIADPPGMQLLQCVRRADTGGSNYLVNANHAALYLREIDPQAYYLLTTVPVHFHRKQKQFQSVHIGPIIEANGDQIKQIRHSYFTLAPFHLPFWLTMAYYNAYRQYASILYDRQSQYRVQLERGDFVLYDNYQMLHAREAFTGPRHLRGVYFRHEDVWKKLGKFSKEHWWLS